MLDTLSRTHLNSLLASLGTPTAAKFDFLYAGRNETPVGVNRRHCRQLHPHGKALVDAGLMRMTRDGTPSSRHTALIITEKGQAELARLTKKVENTLKRHGTPTYEEPHKGAKRFSLRSPADAKAAKTRAIAFVKGHTHA